MRKLMNNCCFDLHWHPQNWSDISHYWCKYRLVMTVTKLIHVFFSAHTSHTIQTINYYEANKGTNTEISKLMANNMKL